MQSGAENDERVMTFAAAALRMTVAERTEFLKVACEGDEALSSEVREVVAWEERMGDFLRQPLIELIDLEERHAPEKPFEPGQEISGRFVILREVGHGGMGIVYEAFDRKRSQRIAIKCAQPGYGRLLSPELEGALKVRHPNVCLVNEIHTTSTEYGETDFLTMEYLEGETLALRLKQERKLTSQEALSIARQLCAGLAAAHKSGVLHRDLKPGNIILTKNPDGSSRVVITDFGLASQANPVRELDGGTPRYMAPELWSGEKASKASDVYSLGVILYEIVTGETLEETSSRSALKGKENPVTPASAPAVGLRTLERLPKAPSGAIKELDGRWATAILPCLKALPAERPQADEVLAIFDQVPLWKSPAVAVGVLGLIALLGAFQQPILNIFKPPDIRLAILPLDAATDLQEMGNGVLQDVADRIMRSREGRRTIVVISSHEASRNNIQTPLQAEKVLHATHAVQVKMRRDGSQVRAEEAVVELQYQTHVSDFSAAYPADSLGDMPKGLAGAVSSALHLRGSRESEQISAAAASAYDRGLYFLRRDDNSFDEAIPRFQEAARLDPHSPLPLAGIAEAEVKKFQMLKSEEARADAHSVLRRAEALNPDSLDVIRSTGLLNEAEGQYTKALSNYQRILEIDPRNIDALLESAAIYDSQDMSVKAEEYYRKAISLDPNYYKPYEFLGAFYFNEGHYQEAEEQFRKEVERSPGSLEGYGNLGGVLLVEGKYQEAVTTLKSALEIKETSQVLNNIGAAFANLKQDQQSVSFYRRALNLAPQNPLYWMNLGDSERRLNDLSEARQAYIKSRELLFRELRTNPARGFSRALLAYLEARLDDRQRAEQEIEQAQSAWPEDNQVIRYAVLAYEALGKRDRALDAASKGTPQLLDELSRHPDLKELCQDRRFVALKTKKGG